jgi:N-acetylglucosamine-6-phosphate deacetylase
VAAIASGRFALVTEAMAATGRGDGDYVLRSKQVRLRDGQAWLADGSSLAGSTLTADRALRTAVDSGAPFLDALAAITATPARAVGLGDVCGTIAQGRAADLAVLDDRLAVRRVMRRGAWVGRTVEP